MSTPASFRKILRATGLLLTALVLLVLSAGTVAYLQRHTVAVLIGNLYLASFGIELRSVSGLQIRFNSISVDSVRFVVIDPDNNELQQESSMVGTHLTFTPGELLQGRIQEVEIASLSLLGFPADRAADSNVEDSLRSRLQLESVVAALQGLPLNSINVDSVSIPPYISNAHIAMTRNYREVSARVTADDFDFSLLTNWHDSAFVSSYFIPDAELPGHIFPGHALTGALRLYFRDELAARADFSLGETDNLLVVDGSGELQFSVLVPLLQQHGLFSGELAGYEGAMHFSASVQEQSTVAEEQSLNFSLSMLGGSHASGPIPSYPGDANATFLWTGDPPLSVSGSYKPQSGNFSLNAENQHLLLTLLSQGEERQLSLELATLSAQCTPEFGCSATQSSTLQIPFVRIGDAVLENVSAVTSAELTAGGNGINVRLDQGSRIAAGRVNAMDARMEDVDLLVLETLTFNTSAAGDIQAQSNGAELYLPSIFVGESNASVMLNATDLSMRWTAVADSYPEISARLQLRNLSVDVLPVVLRKPEVDATVALLNNSLEIDSQIRLADRHVMQLNARHSLTTGTGEGALRIPSLQFDASQQSLSQLFFSMPYEADIISGAIAATGELRWHLDETEGWLVEGPLSISANELSGFYQDIALLNLTTTFSGELAGMQFISDDNLHLRIGSIDPGLPIENISLDYNFNSTTTTMEIRDVQATMFNGTLSSTGLAYNWTAPENLFALALDNIDLSRLLAMGAYEGINATGLISGAMPIRIAGSNISVRGGTLQVEPPGGSISYRSAVAGVSGNAALDLVNQALSNYQYGLLEAEVDYLPSGELILAVKLEGFSPAVNRGQPININLNVTDNIPALLESLQASRNITDALQRGLDER
ncbi:MAG: YdbH domain-containing protein [Gammaproteobacteria bacterium]|nr:YdbH domain-containing protein [Gammaproteobacteria bacterium]